MPGVGVGGAGGDAVGIERTGPFRHRHDGWTPPRQRDFLVRLRQTGCVRDACREVGLTSTSAYRVRQRIPEFAAAWDAALAISLPRLEQAAYARAVEGWDEPIIYQGKVVAHRRRYSDALLRLLIEREMRRPVTDKRPSPAEVDAVMRSAMANWKHQKRMETLRWAEDMEARGLAP